MSFFYFSHHLLFLSEAKTPPPLTQSDYLSLNIYLVCKKILMCPATEGAGVNLYNNLKSNASLDWTVVG